MNTFQDFHFIRPWWLLGLLLIPVLLFFRHRVTRNNTEWDGVVSRDLLNVLIPTEGLRSVRRWIEYAAMSLFLIAIIALAGPTWQRVPSPTEYLQDDLVIVLDLSYSMYAEDVTPSRLIRAKQKIVDLLDNRSEGHTGLIVYASTAHVVTPLTTDNETIKFLLTSLEPKMMPEYGSNVGQALDRAVDLIEQGSKNAGRILLITDGIETLNLAFFEWSKETPLYIIGVGTTEGAAIPQADLEGNLSYLQDHRGNVIVAEMDRNKLTRLAEIAGGNYHDLVLMNTDIEQFSSATWKDFRDRLEHDDRMFDQWSDAGYLLLIPLVLAALFALRRGVVVVLVLCLFMAEDSYANWFTDLWKNRDQKGSEHLEQGEFAEAEQDFTDPEWRAIAQYRQQKFDQAGEYFAADDSPRFLYNYANTLALQGEFAEAINTYNKVLDLDPNHDDAQYNRDLLEQLMQQQNQESQENESNQGTENPQNQEGASERDESVSSESQQMNGNEQNEESDRLNSNLGENDEEPSTDENSEQQSEDGDQEEEIAAAEAEDEESERNENDENLTAAQQDREIEATLERMLRRVNDEPGNLLQQKFLHEARLRYRRGEITGNSSQKW